MMMTAMMLLLLLLLLSSALSFWSLLVFLVTADETPNVTNISRVVVDFDYDASKLSPFWHYSTIIDWRAHWLI